MGDIESPEIYEPRPPAVGMSTPFGPVGSSRMDRVKNDIRDPAETRDKARDFGGFAGCYRGNGSRIVKPAPLDKCGIGGLFQPSPFQHMRRHAPMWRNDIGDA